MTWTPVSDNQTRLRDHYFTNARTLAASASKGLTVWIVALLFVWLTAIEPLQRSITEFERALSDRVSADASLASTRAELLRAYALDTGLDESNVANKSEYDDALAETGRREAVDDRSTRLREAEANVQFKLPGIDVPVPGHYAPIVWMGLLVALVAWLTAMRSRILELCAKGLRIHLGAGLGSENCADLLCDMPAWLLPIPRRDSVATRAALLSALGWRKDTLTRKNTILVVSAVALLAIQLRVATIAAKTADLVDLPGELLIDACASLLVGLLVVMFWMWRHPKGMPDQLPHEPPSASWSRRELVGLGAASVLSATLGPTMQAAAGLGSHQANPRFRIAAANSYRPSLNRGFYVNKSDYQESPRTVHYVNRGGTIKDVVCVNPTNLAPFDVKTSRPERSDPRDAPGPGSSADSCRLQPDRLRFGGPLRM